MKFSTVYVRCDLPGCDQDGAVTARGRSEAATVGQALARFEALGWSMGMRRQWCPDHRRRRDRGGRGG